MTIQEEAVHPPAPTGSYIRSVFRNPGGCSSPVVQGPENHLKPYIFLSRGEAYTWGRGMIAPKALRGARLSGFLPTSPVKRPCGGKMLG